MLHDSTTCMRYLKQSSSLKWKVKWWLPGFEKREKREWLFQEWKVSVMQDDCVLEIYRTTLCS